MADESAPAAELLNYVTAHLLSTFSPHQLSWAYQRALDAVQTTRGNPRLKSLAITLGRLSYSAFRKDRNPTVYDEQAIANDVGARIP
jgi:hypothetical protein